jgi:hypothetical protein
MPGLTDTSPKIATMVRERVMARSGAERMEMGAQMCAAAREMILASLPRHLSKFERSRLLYLRFYGVPASAGAYNRQTGIC